MTARGWAAIVALLFAALLTFLGWLFYVQNAARKVQLSLELPGAIAKWQFSEPIPVLWLIGGAFLVGFLLATIVFGGRAMASSSRVRRLERELAFTTASQSRSATTAAGSGSQVDGWK